MVPVFDESLSITHFDDIVSKSAEFVLRNLIQHILTLQNTPREKKKISRQFFHILLIYSFQREMINALYIESNKRRMFILFRV